MRWETGCGVSGALLHFCRYSSKLNSLELCELAGPGEPTVEGPLRIGRISLDMLGPIPLLEAVVEVSVIKPGRRVHLTEARMIVDRRVVVTARAWHIATGERPPALAESDSQGRREWLAALDTIEGLGPRAVVAGHKRYGKDDAPRTIDETRTVALSAVG